MSEVNLALYRTFAQPWVRAMVKPQTARFLQWHIRARVYERWTDHNPLASWWPGRRKKVRAHRQPVSPDNPLLAMQEAVSGAITAGLNGWRDWRDTVQETTFDLVYGSPLVQALTGQAIGDTTPPRPHPGISPEHCEYVRCETRKMDEDMQRGGLVEAAVRALFLYLPLPHDRRRAQGQPGPQTDQAAIPAGRRHEESALSCASSAPDAA